MNLSLFRLRPVVKALNGIWAELKRANDMKETELAYQDIHIKPPIADTSGEEPETMYTDEQADAIREMLEAYGKVGKKEL